MKTKLLCMMLYIGMLTSVFISCGNDEEDNNVASITKEEVVGTWKCTSSISTYHGNTYTDVLKGETISLMSDGTFTSTTSYIGKSGTWSQKNNTLNMKSVDGGNITLELTMSSNVLTAKGYNNLGETFNCTFVKQ